MEGIGKKLGFTDKKLQILLRSYAVASIVFIIILVICVFAKEYALSRDAAVINLEKIRMGLVRIERSTKDMKQSIAVIEQAVPAQFFTETPEKQILSGLDNLKTIMKNSTINIMDITKKDNRIVLPLTIKGVITDYSAFVNDVGRLQGMSFPFVSITGIAIKKEDIHSGSDQGGQKRGTAVVYEITGELATLAGGEIAGQGGQESTPQPRGHLRGGT